MENDKTTEESIDPKIQAAYECLKVYPLTTIKLLDKFFAMYNDDEIIDMLKDYGIEEEITEEN